MAKNKNKILNKKILLAVVLLGIFVLTNFAFAADEVIIKAGELAKLNKELLQKQDPEGKRKMTECDQDFAGKLSKLDSDSSWDYGWIPFMGKKDNELTSRWNYSNPILANRTCLIYEKIDLSANFADYLTSFGGINSAAITNNYTKQFATTPITMIEWSNALTPIGLARTDYAIQVEQKLLFSNFSITQKSFNETIGQKDGEANTISRIVGWIVNSLINIITSVISIVVAWIGNLLAITIERSILVSWYPGIVQVGWTIVRDIMNMIFIIAMIAMALGTILRIEKYNYKNLLVKVVLMALLINFSYVIAIFLIDFSNMFAKFFYADSQWHELTFIWQNVAWGGGVDGGVSSIANSISGLILSIVMLVAFLALTGMFIIRTVGLWMLIILSPAAFGLNILPATEEYAHKWWSTFSKYIIWAPVALFFLRLAEALLEQLNKINQDQSSVFNKVIVMAFIWGAVKVSQEAGMVGGDMVMKGAKAVGMLPVGAMKMGGGAIARGYTRYTTGKMRNARESEKTWQANLWRAAQFVNLKVAKEAWIARAHEKEEEAYMPAVGDVRDSINRLIPTEWQKEKGKFKFKLGQITHYGRIGQQQLIAKKIAEWDKTHLSEEEKNEALDDAHHAEDVEALSYLHIDGRHFDGYMIRMMKKDPELRSRAISQMAKYYKRKEGLNDVDASAKAEKEFNEGRVAHYDPVEMTGLLRKKFEHAGMSKETIGRIFSHMQEHAEAETKERELGMAVYEFDGRFRSADDFSGFEKLQRERGVKAMIDELQEQAPTLFQRRGDKLYFQPREIGDDGITRDVGTEYEIGDYKQLMNAVNDARDKYDNPYDHQSRMDLGYHLTGSRKQYDAYKRKRRGDTEKWVAAKEPAAESIQFEDGRFRGFNAYGQEAVAKTPAAIISVMPSTRRMQGRMVDKVGLYANDEGHYDLDPVNGNTDYRTMAMHFHLNNDEASAVMQRADLSRSDVEQIRGVMEQGAFSNITQGMTFSLKKNKDGKWYLSRKTGNVEIDKDDEK